MAEVTMTMEEYLQLINGLSSDGPLEARSSSNLSSNSNPGTKKRKQSTAYQRKYKSNFKKVAPKFKLKNGKWKKNGFKSAVKLAHKMSRK